MNRTVLVLMMAVTVEALVEYAKTFGKAILEKQWKTAATQAGAVALGVSLCFSAGADFYAALGVSFNAAWLGVALTGVFASRGANYVSDLVKKLQALGARPEKARAGHLGKELKDTYGKFNGWAKCYELVGKTKRKAVSY